MYDKKQHVRVHPSLNVRYLIAFGVLCASCFGSASAQDSLAMSNYEYDANGNIRKIIDPLNRETDLDYDPLNRVKLVTLPSPAVGAARPVTGFSYDGRNNAVSVKDPLNHTTSYIIDGLGNRRTATSPDTGVTGNDFDGTQNLLSKTTDARQVAAAYTFDDIGRIKSITYPTGTPTTFEYDGGSQGTINSRGHLTKVADESGSTTYEYTPFGELKKKTQSVTADGRSFSHALTYNYGQSGPETGKPVEITYPSGTRILIAYDSAGRPKDITFNPMGLTGTGTDTTRVVGLLRYIDYDTENREVVWAWGNYSEANPTYYARTYDELGRVQDYILGTGPTAVSRRVSYDAAGRIKSYTHYAASTAANATAMDQSFEYDDNDRLVQFISATGTQSYKYDANGNRIQFSVGAAQYVNTIDSSSNKLMSSSGPGQARAAQYDAAGNQLANGPVTYTYSPGGRMATSKVGTTVTSYLYNGFGLRVWKKDSNQTSNPAGIFVYDESGHLIGEYDTLTGRPTREIVYFQDMPVAVLSYHASGAALAQTWSVDVAYIFSDHLNTPRMITRASDNKVVWRWDNGDPFGMVGPNENPSGLGTFTFNLRMPGQYYDKSTNLYYNHFRDYDPSTGRYIQSDPIGIDGGMNTFAYGGGNPVSNVDPTGQFFFVPMLIGLGTGAISDVGFQLLLNGGNVGCIDWGEVGISAGLGAIGGGLGSLTRLKRVGMEFSHWVPDRYLRPLSLSGKSINPAYKPALDVPVVREFLNSSLNGNYVSPLTHALTDPFRNLKGMTAADKLSPALQQLLRIPAWLGGSALGTGAGVANSAMNNNCTCGK